MDKILDAWQSIEFFQPYTLEKHKNSYLITVDKLQRMKDKALPWFSVDLRNALNIPQKEVFYILNLGLFDKSVSNSISQSIVGHCSSDETYETEQRLDTEGHTCFAKVSLGGQGNPSLDKLSVSSLPWALGHLQRKNFDCLNSHEFSSSCEYLKDELDNFSKTLSPQTENGPAVLTADDILRLLTGPLVEWAKFIPDWKYAIQIDWHEGKTSIEQTDTEAGEEELEETAQDKQFKMPILNSFFVEDLELTRAALERKDRCVGLRSWLGENKSQILDLYDQKGLAEIIKQLRPAKMPQGRWPSEPQHPMSLMQQFAINTAIEKLVDGGLLSVNGPPGTGKTTLLRDLMAHNIVERAKVLAGFDKADDSLDLDGFIVAELTGFEMLVASSNNAAVENISKELPQRKSIAGEFQYLDYLSVVANQIAASKGSRRDFKEKKNNEDKDETYNMFTPLPESKRCWGVISAALGKKDNRNKFLDRFFFDKQFNLEELNEGVGTKNLLNFWQWHRHFRHTKFSVAQKEFMSCLDTVKTQQLKLERYESLLASRHQNPLHDIQQEIQTIHSEHLNETEQLALLSSQQAILEEQRHKTELQERNLNKSAPGLFTRLVNHKRVREFKMAQQTAHKDVSNLINQQLALSTLIRDRQQRVLELDKKQRALQRDIERLAQQEKDCSHEYELLQKEFADISLPDGNTSIDNPGLQRTAFWQNDVINRQRSELFIAAMNLHQSWIHEVLKNGKFRLNIFNLDKFLKHPYTEDNPLRFWQLLFMIVPVISTTFASVGRMLHGVESEAFGWLMIDEAGQAPPPQAVGAIRRCKRTLVVGDPLQVEPVFTASPRLVERLCQHKLGEENTKHWNPGLLSVQQIADRTNTWGCWLDVMGQRVWIGIPLWVHRRCREPMFSLANNMAYNGRMIHGFNAEHITEKSVDEALTNHWLVASGGEADKQYRESHGEGLIELLNKLTVAGVELNSIYVITPFKAVKTALSELLSTWSAPSINYKIRDNWIKKSVGTVHTFQGKENDVVILVLGCDEQDCGGAKWAASKPNLLNVALTRAKEHIFVIGDLAVWQELSWFSDVAGKLPHGSPAVERKMA
jgi:hypothetical protein